ncbi:hypothetical protein ACFYW8_10685 [Streptomyces sp. NPDC002742]|uniref:hypothetical protein n=1 Tax=Streptomyces sp. NPDC002742 TaxID=3364663 RepID=UPI0036CB9DCC
MAALFTDWEIAMNKTIRGVRLDVDGTLADVQLPAGDGLAGELCRHIGGRAEIAHYARPDGTRRLAVIVNADEAVGGLENLYATSLVSGIYVRQLPYCLRGPLVLLGALDDSRHYTDIPEKLHAILPKVMDALKVRYGTTT